MVPFNATQPRDYMKNYKAILATAATLLLLQCGGDPIGPPPPPPPGQPGPVMQNVIVNPVGDTAKVVSTWTPGADDGLGAMDSFMVVSRDTVLHPTYQDSVRVIGSVLTATVNLRPYIASATTAGTSCVRAIRRSLSSAYACKPWTVVFNDIAPPVPTLTTVTPTSTLALGMSLRITDVYTLGVDDGNGTYTLSMLSYDTARVHVDSFPITPVAGGTTARTFGPYTPGSTVIGTSCIITTRRGLSSKVCKPFTQVMYDQPPPPPIVNIKLLPAALSLTTSDSGQTFQFCSFVQFADSQYAMRNPDKVLPACVTQYNTLPSIYRVPTTAEQAVADTVQVTYTLQEVLP